MVINVFILVENFSSGPAPPGDWKMIFRTKLRSSPAKLAQIGSTAIYLHKISAPCPYSNRSSGIKSEKSCLHYGKILGPFKSAYWYAKCNISIELEL